MIAEQNISTNVPVMRLLGNPPIDAIRPFSAEPQVMYNLSVQHVATYLVGEQRWVVHNAEISEIPIDIHFLEYIGVSVINISRISESFIRLATPSTYAEIGTVIGDFETGSFGQILGGLRDLSRENRADFLTLRVRAMVNPSLIRLSFNPRFLDRYQLEILNAKPNIKLINEDLLSALREVVHEIETPYTTKAYRTVLERGQQPFLDITFRCKT